MELLLTGDKKTGYQLSLGGMHTGRTKNHERMKSLAIQYSSMLDVCIHDRSEGADVWYDSMATEPQTHADVKKIARFTKCRDAGKAGRDPNDPKA